MLFLWLWWTTQRLNQCRVGFIWLLLLGRNTLSMEVTAGAEADTLEEPCLLLHSLLSAQLAFCLGMVPPTVDWALLHQLTIKSTSHKHALRPFFQSILADVKLATKPNQYNVSSRKQILLWMALGVGLTHCFWECKPVHVQHLWRSVWWFLQDLKVRCTAWLFPITIPRSYVNIPQRQVHIHVYMALFAIASSALFSIRRWTDKEDMAQTHNGALFWYAKDEIFHFSFLQENGWNRRSSKVSQMEKWLLPISYVQSRLKKNTPKIHENRQKTTCGRERWLVGVGQKRVTRMTKSKMHDAYIFMCHSKARCFVQWIYTTKNRMVFSQQF